MCLHTVSRKKLDPIPEFAYKAFERDKEGHIGAIYMRHPRFEVGRWIEDRLNRPIGRAFGKEYLSGYHAYLKQEEAEKFKEYEESNRMNNIVIRKVKICKIVAHGTQSGSEVVVFKKMFIIHKRRSKKD
jgi:hypothetical protein